jgi:hypothetical protein
MRLADIGSLSSQEIQLLADCSQFVFMLELTPAAETLVQRGLLRSSRCKDLERTFFVLTCTDAGRACVAEWLEEHSKGANDSAIVPIRAHVPCAL